MKRQKTFLGILVAVAIVLTAAALYVRTQFVLPVLMYHRVDENAAKSKLSVSPESFKAQMAFLARHNYAVISLAEAVELLASEAPLPRKTVVLTFDDGYKNNYTVAAPILEKYGFPATIFVPPCDIGREGFLTWDDLRAMRRTGWTVGSHTLNDVYLPDPALSDEMRLTELTESKRVLEEGLGAPVEFLSYPLGGLTPAIKNMARLAGYRAAVATNPGRASDPRDIFAIKRVRISRTSDNLFVFFIESSGYYTLIKEVRDD